MNFRKSRLVQAILCLAFVALFSGAVHVLTSMSVDSRNRQQVSELSAQMLRRTELGVDFAFMALGSIAETSALSANGGKTCSPALRAELRQNVFRRATIKDIRILDANGRILCAAFPETVRSILFRVDLTHAVAARNAQLRLMAIPGQSSNDLGVVWDLDNKTHLMAIVNTSALLFDILPAAIRDDSRAAVSLLSSTGSNGIIASYIPVSGL